MVKMSTICRRLSLSLKGLAGLIGAVTTIIGALFGMYTWASTKFTNAIAAEIQEFKEEIIASNEAQDLAIMRIELLTLIKHDPENVVEIEILGKKYFSKGGNSWMSKFYSEYAKEHNLDTSFIVNH